MVLVLQDPRCSHVELDAIAMGNEVDLRDDCNKRPENWTIYNYKDEQYAFYSPIHRSTGFPTNPTWFMIEYFNAINDALGPNNKRNFRVGDFASSWTTSQILGTGLFESEIGRYVHDYTQQSTLARIHASHIQLNHHRLPTPLSGLRRHGRSLRLYDDSVAGAQAAGLDFVLGRTGSKSGHGQAGVGNAAASVIRMVDYRLQAAVRGVRGLHFHQGVGYNYSGEYLHITPFTHGAFRWAKFLLLQPSNPSMVSDKTSRLAGAIGSSGDATGAHGEDETRPSTALSIAPLGATTKSARFKTLCVDSLLSTKGLTWGEQSWETLSGLPSAEETFRTLKVSSASGRDSIKLEIHASSLGIVYFDLAK
ncbi:hypothetical protein BDW69DRAFT_183048 [Aspergillus filifer]